MGNEEKEYNKSDYHNDWALDIKANPIHIVNAKSGAQGYYCLGCDKEMQGVKFINPNYQSYFRHHVKNIDQEKVKCVVASKVYRERLAETILSRLKFVKVPALYKYPPKDTEGVPMFLQKSKIITASYVKAQEWFYEDESGKIQNGKNPDVEDRFLLIRPDVTFFDEKKIPILFIEFVITHKFSIEKKLKLSRLGINTVQIIIPKVPEEEIEKALKSSQKYKWVYNELEANSTYISVSKGNPEGISSIDEEQRRLFEESFQCRSAQINKLVLNINNCLRSESYKGVRRLFESELSRVAQNRKSTQQRLGVLEEQYRGEAFSRNRSVEDRIRTDKMEFQQNFKSEEKELRSNIEKAEQRLGEMEESNRRIAHNRNRGEEEEVDSEQSDLERRYLIKDRSIEQGFDDNYRSQNIGISIKRKIEGEERIIKGYREEKNSIIERFESEEYVVTEELHNEFSSKIEFEESEISRIEQEERNLDEKVRADINFKIDVVERDIYRLREQQERVVVKARGEFRAENEFEDSEIIRIEREQKNIERTVRDEFYREIKDSSSKLPRAIKTILDAKRLGDTYAKTERKEASYQRARELFNKGTWEKG